MIVGLEFATVYCVMVLLQDIGTDFQNLGMLLLGGMALATVLAIAFTVIRFRIRDKKPQRSSFISIGAQQEDQ